MQHTRVARQKGFTDALLLSRSNIVLEGPTFSICWIEKETIFTPSLDLGILDSITRKYLFSICNLNKIKIKEVEASVDELLDADAVFLISTAMHAMPVFKIDDCLYPENQLIKTLQGLYKKTVESEKANYLNY